MSAEPLTDEELKLQIKWLDECVEPHFDNGGQATTKNAVALYSALRQSHATIESLRRERDEAKARCAKIEGSLANVSAKVLQESAAIFAMWPEGVTSIDKPRLEVMAKKPDSSAAFFATVILQVLASIEAGHMKNVRPERIIVRMKL